MAARLSWAALRLDVRGPAAAVAHLRACFAGYSDEHDHEDAGAVADACVTIEPPGAAPPDGARLVTAAGPDGGGAARVLLESRERLVVALADESEASHLVALRAVRALFASLIMERGAAPLHAAAFAAAGAGHCLVGDKRRGKTTGLLGALRGGAAMIANDTIFLEQAGAGLVVRGLPVAACVRRSTIAHFPEVAALQAAPGELHPENPTAAELRASGPDAKLSIRPRELARAFGSRVAPSAPVRSIVEMRVDPTLGHPTLSRLSASAARAALTANLLRDPMEQARTLRVQPPMSPILPETVSSARVPVYRLVHAGRDPGVARRMLLSAARVA